MAKGTSIVVDDLNHCWVCGSSNVEIHHIFGASNRDLSTKYKLVIGLCREHHTGDNGVHFNKKAMDALHKRGQEAFNEHYPELNFIELFGKNYI